MLPRIETPFGPIYTYVLFCALGVLSFLLVLHVELAKDANRGDEEAFIFPAAVASGVVAFLSSVVVDAVFKIGATGHFELRGSTFYGGLLGACACMWLSIERFGRSSSYGLREWFDILTLPLIAFHVCGRLGCFFAGCCYGVQVDAPWGIVFPDNPEAGIYHHGVACLPTQLIEVAVLIGIALLTLHSRSPFVCYLLSYASARFVIEFFRGDFRGFSFGPLSPAQLVSLLILVAVAMVELRGAYARQSFLLECSHRSDIGGNHEFS